MLSFSLYRHCYNRFESGYSGCLHCGVDWLHWMRAKSTSYFEYFIKYVMLSLLNSIFLENSRYMKKLFSSVTLCISLIFTWFLWCFFVCLFVFLYPVCHLTINADWKPEPQHQYRSFEAEITAFFVQKGSLILRVILQIGKNTMNSSYSTCVSILS